MPSTDRPPSHRDRPEPEAAPHDSGRAGPKDAPIEPPQYFDPREPWDQQAAEALTRLYESGEGYLHRRPEDDRARRLQPPLPEAPNEPPAGERRGRDDSWLEARLVDIAARLQGSLAEINPDKALAHLNGRLDMIEERFNEAMSQVVQRSDLEGLKLIEAHVMELAAHVEHTRGRLDRIDAIDDQMQSLARRLQDGEQQRLDTLEKLLQDYVQEWRQGDERTTSTLRNLEGVVNRIGETIETMEAQKPAPDLSLSLLDTPGLGETAIESDPLSQVYADAARVLQPATHRSSLDAADYAPRNKIDSEVLALALSREHPPQPADQHEAKPDDSVPSPSLLVSMMRTKLRQALGEGETARADQQTKAEASPPAPHAPRRRFPNLLLTGGITLFAAIGYLLVDMFMTTSAAQRRPAAIEYSSGPAATEAAAATVARIDAIGSAMAAAFRRADQAERPVVATTASIQKDALPMPGEVASPAAAALPMTIGPASLRQAAMRGDPAAQAEVASRFAVGQGVGRDLQQALQWYGRAAAQGLAIAQYRYAALYERGLGTTRDPERARIWYARAAEQGNVKAMHNLAVLSVSAGRSDYAAAAKWFAQAAEFGLADSQVNLAILHQNGLGVSVDLAQAYKWLTLARQGGDQEAAARAAQVRVRLSATQLETIDAAVAAWRARTPDPSANEPAAVAALNPSQ